MKVNGNISQCKEIFGPTAGQACAAKLTLVATCAYGLESALCEELKRVGALDIHTGSGAVMFKGDLATAYAACLWSRVANRILLRLGEFCAKDEKDLYDGIYSIEWELHVSPHGTIAVQSVSANSGPIPPHYASLRAKDAIVDRIRERRGLRPSVKVFRPDVQIHLFLDGEIASLSIDLAGEALHKRGYRRHGGMAPVKETLAAGILMLAGWPFDAGGILVDPMCGSGTFLVEAALMSLDVAPGLGREYFGLQGWLGHDETIWTRVKEEALDRKIRSVHAKEPFIFGFDASKAAVSEALKNVVAAGVANAVRVERRELAQLKAPERFPSEGRSALLVANPPYGERIDSTAVAGLLQRCLARKLKEGFVGWKAAILSASENPFVEEGLICLKRHSLFNGPIPCQLKILDIPLAEFREAPLVIKSQAHEGDALANRIRKNFRLLRNLTEVFGCYRLYDADIPEYNVSIDIYDREARIKEHHRPHGIDDRKADERLRHCAKITSELLCLGKKAMHVIPSGMGGAVPYPERWIRRLKEVKEGEAHFLVDLDAYRECGLSLIRRSLRGLIKDMAKGTGFLNLYCGAGAETLSAAIGGASFTRSFDGEKRNIQWSAFNLALNGFSTTDHVCKKTDLLGGLAACRERFGLILLSLPPDRARRSVEVQTLIEEAVARLSSGGRIVLFSEARIHPPLKPEAYGLEVEDISRRMTPRDFIRSAAGLTCLILSARKPGV